MYKFLYLPIGDAAANLAPVLIDVTNIKAVDKPSGTVTHLKYSTENSTDFITFTTVESDSGHVLQNWLVEEIRKLLSTGYTSTGPLLTPPLAIASIAIS